MARRRRVILTPFLDDYDVIVYQGDCIDVMRELPEASVDAVVTDPPYGLEFMGKDWDAFAPTDRKNAAVWNGRRQAQMGWQESAKERSGKGGGGPSYRSQHKGAKRCQTCGKRQFSGTPCKCVNPDWVVEHRQEAPSTMLGFQAFSEAWAREAYRVLKPGGHLLAFAGTRTYHRMAAGVEDAGFEIRDCIAWMYGSGFPKSRNLDGKWSGWGTALKPAFEPIVVARKPLTGTVAKNVLTHGTGALNINACRIAAADPFGGGAKATSGFVNGYERGEGWQAGSDLGRWPANVALDETAASVLDEQSGTAPPKEQRTAVKGGNKGALGAFAGSSPDAIGTWPADPGGGASRFFYTAKASRQDRNVGGLADNTHPTVKPTDLMRWLIRLVTPPGGIILDPFGGSGSTGLAARAENTRCILIEREPEYLQIIKDRLAQLSLFSVPEDGAA